MVFIILLADLLFSSSMTTLFQVDPTITSIIPSTFAAASKLATALLRALFVQDQICSMFDIEGSPHIDQVRLDAVLGISELFVVDKIRHNSYIDARACVMRQYDPWKIYLNPLLLLEMQDKEREANELLELTEGSQSHPDLLGVLAPFAADQQPSRRKHNALLYLQQVRSARGVIVEPMAVPYPPTSTTAQFSIHAKHVLMLSILLVHAACHLLNFHLSSVFSSRGGMQQSTIIPPDRTFPDGSASGLKRTFNDFGHMVERTVFGFAIQHAFDGVLPSRFGIDDIIGMYGQNDTSGVIVHPNPLLLGLINRLLENPECECVVTDAMFPLERVNDVAIETASASSAGKKRKITSSSRVLFVQSVCDEDEVAERGDRTRSSFDVMTNGGRV